MKHFLLMASSAIVISATQGFASAQTADHPEDGTRYVDTIIVTAQRQEESIQETPIAVTAFNQDDLDIRQVASTTQLRTSPTRIQISAGPTSRYAASVEALSVTARIAASLFPSTKSICKPPGDRCFLTWSALRCVAGRKALCLGVTQPAAR